MKWAGMYFLGFAIVIGGVLAALWKLGLLQQVGTTWIVIAVAILVGIGLMVLSATAAPKRTSRLTGSKCEGA